MLNPALCVPTNDREAHEPVCITCVQVACQAPLACLQCVHVALSSQFKANDYEKLAISGGRAAKIAVWLVFLLSS
jgi:hypothetical protein